MKKNRIGNGFFGLVLATLVISGCQGYLDSSNTTDGAFNASPEKGVLQLTINGKGLQRTILPLATEDDFEKFVLTFTYTGDGDIEDPDPEEWVNTSGAVVLEVGTYNLVVKAYLGASDANPTAQSEEIPVSVPASEPVNVLLKPITSGNGTFKWTVTYPDNVTYATISIEDNAAGSSFTPQNIAILSGTEINNDNGLITKTGTVSSLPAGCYRVTFSLTDDTGKSVELQEIMYIYYNLQSVFEQNFDGYIPTPLLDVVLNAKSLNNSTGKTEWDFGTAGIHPGHFDFLGINGVTDSNFDALIVQFNTLCNAEDREFPNSLATLKVLVDASLIRNENGKSISNASQYAHRGIAEEAIRDLAVNGSYVSFEHDEDDGQNIVHVVRWYVGSDGNYTVPSIGVNENSTWFDYACTIGFDGYIGEVVNWWEGLNEPYDGNGPTGTTLARRYDVFQEKTEVLRVTPNPAYNYKVMGYDINDDTDYNTGKTITFNVSMDVWVDAWEGVKRSPGSEENPPTIVWLLTDNYSREACGSYNQQLSTGQWHTLAGSVTLTVPAGYPSIYFAGDHLGDTEVYIANFRVVETVLPAGGTPVSGTLANGLIIREGTNAYEFTSFESKTNALYVAPKGIYDWRVLSYDLSASDNSKVSITLSMNVWVDEPALMVWQVRHTDSEGQHYVLICGDYDIPLVAGWNPLQGQLVDIELGSNSELFFSAEQFGLATAYIADFNIKVGSSASFDLSFGFEDITAPAGISMSFDPSTYPKTLTVDNPSQYTNIAWFIGSTQLNDVSGTDGETISLTPSTFDGAIGNHSVRLEVIKGGQLYTKNITVNLTL